MAVNEVKPHNFKGYICVIITFYFFKVSFQPISFQNKNVFVAKSAPSEPITSLLPIQNKSRLRGQNGQPL